MFRFLQGLWRRYRNPPYTKIEEGLTSYFKYVRPYYPVLLGDTLLRRYKVYAKLGWGTRYTVWLVKDSETEQWRTLKVSTTNRMKGDHDIYEEVNTLYDLYKADPGHPGYDHMVHLIYAFSVSGPRGMHRCCVMKLMGETLRQYRAHKNIFPKRSYDTQTLKRIFRHLLLGLDYVHSSGYIHTGKLKAILYKHFVLKYLLTRAAVQDLQPSNLFVDVQSGEEIEEFLTRAPPMDLFSRLRRGSVMPTTRWLSSEDYKNIHVRIADFSEAVRIDTMNKATYVQPFRLRAPEVFLGLGWTEKIDIWNLGCILWELSQGRHLFDARNVKTKEYDWRVHFHEIEAQLGLPPQKYIDAFNKKKGWFVPKPRYGAPFEELEGMLQGDDQQKFFSFMRAMLQWLPKDRVSAKELLQHEWLNSDST